MIPVFAECRVVTSRSCGDGGCCEIMCTAVHLGSCVCAVCCITRFYGGVPSHAEEIVSAVTFGVTVLVSAHSAASVSGGRVKLFALNSTAIDWIM